jgi:hypothetical protein
VLKKEISSIDLMGMRMKKNLITGLAALTLIILAMPAMADTIEFFGSSGNLDASATFSVEGTYLQVILTNISSADVLHPADILTALFFDISGNPTLTPVSATLTPGSTVYFDPDGQPVGGNVGGEWAYKSGLSGTPGGAGSGISSSGLGLFGAANFGGTNLQGPAAVNGGQYGITSVGDNTSTGNTPVTGGEALIKYSVTFKLSGTPTGFDLSQAISNVTFQYGTALTDTNFPGCISEQCGPIANPEPSSLLLLGTGLGALGWSARRKKK